MKAVAVFSKSIPAIGARLLGCALLNTAAAAPISSTFDFGTELWAPSLGQGVVTHVANGGNPGGHIVARDLAVGRGNNLFLVAPAAYHGDLSRFDGGTISVDFTQVSTGSTQPFLSRFGRVQISSNIVDLQTDLNAADLVPGSTPIPSSGFQTYTTEFSAAGFGLSQQDWISLISNVTDLRIDMESFPGANNERVGVDNISISERLTSVDSFVFTGACGNNDWHATCAATNWIGDAGQAVNAPPGDAPEGDENATINETTVRVVERDVALNSLSATGQLELLTNLSLKADSSVENLLMGVDVTLTTEGDLTLTGEGELRGNLETPDGSLIFNDGRYTSSGNVLLDGKFLNGDTVDQSGNFLLAGTVANAGDWTARNGFIVKADEAGGTFDNLDTLIGVGESELLADYQGRDGSKIEAMNIGAKLLLGAGGTFHGTTEINTQIGAKVVLRGVQDDKAVFRVTQVFDEGSSPGLLTVRPEEGRFGGTLEIGAFSALNIDDGSSLSVQESFLELTGGDLTGRTVIGNFQNRFDSFLSFNAGRLGVSDDPAMRAEVTVGRVGTMTIRGDADDTRSLFGDIAIDGQLLQSAMLDMQESNVTIRDGARWEISGGGLQSDAASTITLESSLSNLASEFATLTLTGSEVPNLTVDFAGQLDNKGVVLVREATLNFTGTVIQVAGETLQGGGWVVDDGGKLQIGNGTIRAIGEDAAVLLSDGGVITNLELAGNSGQLFLTNTNLTTGPLLNNGKIETRDTEGPIRSTLEIEGSLTNNSELIVGVRTTVRTTEYITAGNSKTHVNGRLEITDVDAVFRGTYSGFGVVQALQIEMRAADIRGGSSPGILTFDTPLFIADEDTVFHIEIGGTEAGTGYDLLMFTGEVVLAGTLVFDFIDGFVPDVTDLFTFFEATGGVSGQFDRLVFNGLGGDPVFDLLFDGGRFSLANVTADVNVPEPGALGLLAVGLIGLGWARRWRAAH